MFRLGYVGGMVYVESLAYVVGFKAETATQQRALKVAHTALAAPYAAIKHLDGLGHSVGGARHEPNAVPQRPHAAVVSRVHLGRGHPAHRAAEQRPLIYLHWVRGAVQDPDVTPLDEAVRRMEGIRCGNKPTSCPDQIAQALKTAQQ